VGAGGGSIASVDAMGLLRVGRKALAPRRAGVLWPRRRAATMTDAAVALGYIDPNFFLGGNMGLVADAARRAIADKVAGPLGVSIEEAALSILDLTTESMVNAIEDITVKQGIDPADTVIIGGGGAAGINAVSICPSAALQNRHIPRRRRGAQRGRRGSLGNVDRVQAALLS